MGRRPTLGDESHIPRRPRGSGDPWRVDSRFRGNDLTFERGQGEISLCFDAWGKQSERDSSLRSE